MKTIELKTASVTLRDDGIMHIHIKEGNEMMLADAIQVVETIGKLGNKQKFPILIDCGEFATVDKEVRVFWASKDANIYTLADAVAYHSLAHKLLVNFYMNHNKPETLTKVFPNNEDAIDWLKTLIKDKITIKEGFSNGQC
ncbi:MAG: DUF7793 family protein [Bacteroidia bacterium]